MGMLVSILYSLSKYVYIRSAICTQCVPIFIFFLLKEKCKAYCMNSFASNVNHTNPTCFAKSLLGILADSQR